MMKVNNQIKKLVNLKRSMTISMLAWFMLFASLSPMKAAAYLCDQAAAFAASEHDVPLQMLLALSRTETGRAGGNRSIEPWPWTINDGRKGHWFDDRQSAEIHARTLLQAGRTSFDTGCFQINYRWHHHKFSSLEEMFDPITNADYAASFLKELHHELGGWPEAVSAYHSRTPKYASRYLSRFREIYATLEGTDRLTVASNATLENKDVESQERRPNQYPLLQASENLQSAQFGSLMPGTSGRGPLFSPRGSLLQ